jgi:hypothetical protein
MEHGTLEDLNHCLDRLREKFAKAVRSAAACPLQGKSQSTKRTAMASASAIIDPLVELIEPTYAYVRTYTRPWGVRGTLLECDETDAKIGRELAAELSPDGLASLVVHHQLNPTLGLLSDLERTRFIDVFATSAISESRRTRYCMRECYYSRWPSVPRLEFFEFTAPVCKRHLFRTLLTTWMRSGGPQISLIGRGPETDLPCCLCENRRFPVPRRFRLGI